MQLEIYKWTYAWVTGFFPPPEVELWAPTYNLLLGPPGRKGWTGCGGHSADSISFTSIVFFDDYMHTGKTPFATNTYTLVVGYQYVERALRDIMMAMFLPNW